MRLPRAAEKWLDEGWSPIRIGYGVLGFVALLVTVSGYAAHPHHPGAVWWLLGAVAVVAAWALLELVRGRVRYTRLQRQLADARSRLDAPAITTQLEPLRPHYEELPPYRRPSRELSEYRTEHHVGIRNPDSNPVVTGVRMEWTAISPQPSVWNPVLLPAIPCAVPRDSGGDPAIGIDLPPGRQELWGPISTWIGPDGRMAVREFPADCPTTRGDPTGHPYPLQPGDRLRFNYRIVADNLPYVTFSLVVTAADGHIQCDLEG